MCIASFYGCGDRGGKLGCIVNTELGKIRDRDKDWGMWAHMDWFCDHAGVTRVFEDDKVFEIDDYIYALPFVVRKRYQIPDKDGFIGELEYVGAIRAPTLSEYRAIRNATHKAMYRGLSSRVKQGTKRTIEICTRHGERGEVI